MNELITTLEILFLEPLEQIKVKSSRARSLPASGVVVDEDPVVKSQVKRKMSQRSPYQRYKNTIHKSQDIGDRSPVQMQTHNMF